MIPDGFPDGFYGQGHPYGLYEEVRAEGGLVRHPSLPLWVAASHAAVHAVASDPAAYRSGDGILIDEIGKPFDTPPTIMHTDPPEHGRYRGLVAPAFRPSAMRRLEGEVRERIRALLEPVEAGRPFDVVAELAVPLPLQVICLLLGIPEDDWPRFFRWSESIVPGAAPELSDEERAALRMEAGLYLVEVSNERRAAPRDDVISQLAQAEVDGDRLTDVEMVMFLIQLLVAGNETTRHAISGGLLAFAENPDQWEAMKRPGAMPTAIEEILRWASPVVYFLRTATRPAVLVGRKVEAGDHIMLLYGSANRDPEAFGPDVDRFDVTRRPEAPGLAFGYGPHFCLGAALARMEMRLVLQELRARHGTVTVTGEPVYNGSPVVVGLRSLGLAFG
ncbi:cytochrome P450 [Actinomadura verrucosospora]|uniref:Cytochrome P450 124A1, Cyp124A1 n=1 Tax=Actinomadura verrucosospora TaxID=46165 RepID=A0A7D3ZXX7_ACTVE|nr:cytochrome P450 [Actinomadura verrucosospora]QKG22486.1 cytochrome P450 124A1, Cyp124A1 [Actinomadura verrucosospora]